MVDPQTGIPPIGISKIVPERVNPFAGVKLAERIGPALIDHLAVDRDVDVRFTAETELRRRGSAIPKEAAPPVQGRLL